ncbi:rhamnan synthesis F family protein [Pseudomonas shirazica]|uniref:rhamnan synthesis F family protein n=1 Tax=Pseudomonas shirazica TaxID=1940636 RepID=UPI001C26A6CA|nr:rhamnan synthesis F family protein [Pseudomonas shirazica]
MSIFHRIADQLVYPAAHAYVSLQSHVNWFKSLGKSDQVFYSSAYQGQKIVLMALYQKGTIRNDVIHFLRAAKALGLYVVCVNTLKLKQPDLYSDVIDCYIEKYNYGRDFGSYKSGFKYLYSSGLAEQCPRMLLVNDSVFFSRKHNVRFLEEMFDSSVEVLGATENYEIEHHLGSFCIALGGGVLNHPKLKKYWQNYKCTDVRPVVIKTGEMALSKTLKRIVSSPDNFKSLYDTERASALLHRDDAVLEDIAHLSRTSALSLAPRFSFSSVSKEVINKYLHSPAAIAGVSALNADFESLSEIEVHYADSLTGFSEFVCGAVTNSSSASESIRSAVKGEVISKFIGCFMHGSQIHQNGIFLHRIGLPIIKLDGVYRGMFSPSDIEKLAMDLESDQRGEFRWIMYSRPYGGDVLYGWKRAAFSRGLI